MWNLRLVLHLEHSSIENPPSSISLSSIAQPLFCYNDAGNKLHCFQKLSQAWRTTASYHYHLYISAFDLYISRESGELSSENAPEQNHRNHLEKTWAWQAWPHMNTLSFRIKHWMERRTLDLDISDCSGFHDCCFPPSRNLYHWLRLKRLRETLPSWCKLGLKSESGAW